MVVWVVAWWCEKLQFKFAIRFRRRVGPSFTDRQQLRRARHTEQMSDKKSGRARQGAQQLLSTADANKEQEGRRRQGGVANPYWRLRAGATTIDKAYADDKGQDDAERPLLWHAPRTRGRPQVAARNRGRAARKPGERRRIAKDGLPPHGLPPLCPAVEAVDAPPDLRRAARAKRVDPLPHPLEGEVVVRDE